MYPTNRIIMNTINKLGCKFLRAKNAYGTMEGGDSPFLPLDEGTTTYWCLKTCGPVGPDNQFVHTGACSGKRLCYEGITIKKDGEEAIV